MKQSVGASDGVFLTVFLTQPVTECNIYTIHRNSNMFWFA